MAGSGNHTELDGVKYAGDFQDRERLVRYQNNITKWCDHPWQAWVTIDKNQWSYNPNPLLMSAKELVRDLVTVIGCNGNYMINLGPSPEGDFAPAQIALMDSLGMWLKAHADAVYGTRGGPYYPADGCVSTRKGNKAWLFVTDDKLETISLPSLPQTIVSAKDFETGKKVAFSNNDGKTTFTLPKTSQNAPVRVIKLKFKDDVKMYPVKPKDLQKQNGKEKVDAYY